MIKKTEIQVFFASMAFLFLETAVFHVLLFTRSHLEANLVISYALLGLGIGSLVTFFLKDRGSLHFPAVVGFFVLSITLVFINVTRFPGLVHLSPFMILPFAVGNIIITQAFRRGNTNRIYFSNLLGAFAGIIFSVAFIPTLKTENAVLLCIGVLCLLGLLFSQGVPYGRTIRSLSLLFLIVSLGTMGLNLRWHFLDLEVITRSAGSVGSTKDVFQLQTAGRPFFLSRDSLVARISLLKAESDHQAVGYDGTVNSSYHVVCFDGSANDVVENTAPIMYRNDPRIPFMYFENGRQVRLFSQPPRVFIIGTSAQGIVKSIKFLTGDDSLIQGVEINPAIVKLMENQLFEPSAEAYRNVDVEIMDGRAFLKHSGARYDLITLMNTYITENIGYFGEPDFIHTTEAFGEYLDHLKEGGFLLLEERDVDRLSRFAIYRLLHNLLTVLKDRGAAEPEKHFFIYNVNPDKKKPRGGWYTFIVVKKTPITPEERNYFLRWIDARRNIEYILKQETDVDMDFTYQHHTQLEYLHGVKNGTDYSRFIQAPDRDSFWGEEVRLTPTTDDNPYIFDIARDRRDVRALVRKVGIVCGVLVFFAAAILFRTGGKRAVLPSIPFLFYFTALGLGYFIIEIMLMKFYQSYTGSPTYSLIFVLGGLFLSSGLGSYFSRRYSPWKIILSFIGILVFSLYHMYGNRHLLDAVRAPVLLENILVAVTIFPLGFCMGIPFPLGIETVKKSFSERQVPVFISVNALVSAFGIPFGLYLSVSLGFLRTAMIGVGFYAFAMGLYWLISRRGARGPVLRWS